MGVLLQVRDVDEAVRDALKTRAKEAGVSLNTYVRNLLTREVAVPSRRQMLERLVRRGPLVDAGKATAAVREARTEQDRVLEHRRS